VRRAGRVEVALSSTLDCLDPASSPLDRALAGEKAGRYHAGLARLEAGERELIVGRIELGLSYQQLALATDRPSPDAARVAVRRALLRLGEVIPGD
jgi:RNA polymerase sigma-70 factor (ECF subfamily)